MKSILRLSALAFAACSVMSFLKVSTARAQSSGTVQPTLPGSRIRVTCKYSPGDPWIARQTAFFNEKTKDWTNDTLRTALLKAAGLAVPLQMPVSYGFQINGHKPAIGSTAASMVEELKKLAAARGSVWPTRSVVGAAGTHAVYLLAQQDTGLARTTLKRMMEAGPDESPAIDVAVFEDRMRVLSGRKQLYGTQFTSTNGTVVLSAMEDSAHADLRREGAGLPPFKLGMCFAQQR